MHGCAWHLDLLEDHRRWVVEVCESVEVEALEPLWGEETGVLLNEALSRLNPVLTRAKKDLFPEDAVGRPLQEAAARGLLNRAEVDPCGEYGEYHTVVLDGPRFNFPLTLMETRIEVREEMWSLDIIRFVAGRPGSPGRIDSQKEATDA